MIFGTTLADLGATPRNVSWRALRGLRADPWGYATGDRRETFVMALEQSEQLFTAAATTGPAARPLVLFYALSQAGRAVLAALQPTDPWRPRVHGIGEASDNGASATVADFKIEPRGGKAGAFGMLTAALGSSSIPTPTRLGDLWPLLPDTQRFQLPNSGPRRLLEVQINPTRFGQLPIGGEIFGLPLELGVRRGPDEDPSAPRNDWAEEERRVRAFLADYPGLCGYQFPTGGGQPIGFSRLDDSQAHLKVHWPNEPDNLTAQQLSRRVAYSYAGNTNAYPCLDASGRPVHPLVVWWALLFGLSILARYEPERWGRAIDVNTSLEAVAIEHVLNTAVDSLPELLYRTLTDNT